mmetsp:Transcript_6256/g.6464  ORF Transcript_6256/g.6464 Transcript_6256/m.6464 type:complete len:167 (-) Transcript_6256:303-803(-)
MRLVLPNQFIHEMRYKELSYHKLAALDVGKKRIGVSITDFSKQIVQPWGSIDRKHHRFSKDSIIKLSNSIDNLISNENIGGIVVGYPLHTDGSRSLMCKEIYRLLYMLEHSTQNTILCTLHDERYSTMQARRLSYHISEKREGLKQRRDSLAACLILQSFIETWMS